MKAVEPKRVKAGRKITMSTRSPKLDKLKTVKEKSKLMQTDNQKSSQFIRRSGAESVS